MNTKRQKPIHPGEILSEEFLKPMGITQYRLALDIRVPPRRINEIVLGKRGISADTALRLARYLGTSVDVWMNLQTRFEVETTRDEEGEIIEREIRQPQTLEACWQSRRRLAGMSGCALLLFQTGP